MVLTDIIMPDGISGRDLATQLLARRPELKIIFMSGYSGDALGKDADFIRETQGRFLEKPCSASSLLETVRRCLDEKYTLETGLIKGNS